MSLNLPFESRTCESRLFRPGELDEIAERAEKDTLAAAECASGSLRHGIYKDNDNGFIVRSLRKLNILPKEKYIAGCKDQCANGLFHKSETQKGRLQPDDDSITAMPRAPTLNDMTRYPIKSTGQPVDMMDDPDIAFDAATPPPILISPERHSTAASHKRFSSIFNGRRCDDAEDENVATTRPSSRMSAIGQQTRSAMSNLSCTSSKHCKDDTNCHSARPIYTIAEHADKRASVSTSRPSSLTDYTFEDILSAPPPSMYEHHEAFSARTGSKKVLDHRPHPLRANPTHSPLCARYPVSPRGANPRTGLTVSNTKCQLQRENSCLRRELEQLRASVREREASVSTGGGVRRGRFLNDQEGARVDTWVTIDD